MHMKENQMNAISVDNECFYSDHIIIKKPNILEPKELKMCYLYALPHEYRPLKRKKNKELVPRKRSNSNDIELMAVEKLNKKDVFGKCILEQSDCSNKKKVGPLKIIRLPSERSIPETVEIAIDMKSSMNLSKFRGSIKSPLALDLVSPKNFEKEYKIFSTKHSLNKLRFSPAISPKRYGHVTGKNSRKLIKSPFILAEVKEKSKKKLSRPLSKKMESDKSASSSQTDSSGESSDSSSSSSN